MTPLFRWILSYARPYRARLAVLAGLSLIEVGLGALTPWPIAIVVDNVLERHPWPAALGRALPPVSAFNPVVLLGAVILVQLAIELFDQFVSMAHTQVQVDTGQRMVYDLRARLFAHLQALDMRHHTSVSAGDAVYRLDSDAYCLENLVMTGVFPLASAAATLTVMLVILVRLDWRLAALSMGVVPFLYAILRYFMRPLGERAEYVKELESTLSERLYETFSAIRLVKSFARERHEQNQFGERARTAMRERVSLTWQESLFSVGISGVTIVGSALVLWVGGMDVLRGRLQLGELLVVIAYLGMVYGPLSDIAHTAGQLQEALASARRIRRTLEVTPEIVDEGAGRRAAEHLRGHIVFDRVSFSYDEAVVLHDVSFEALPGETVALVGLTGAGKSTVASLIPRFYDPVAGHVLIDGHDVREYNLRVLRERIAMVLQDPVLFRGTIADNIRYGRLEASDDEVRRAAVAAHADEFITRLDRQYDAEIGEGGSGLSGGERQRLSIARAVLKDAPVLILDEPTSSLDALSEEIVFKALKRLRAGRTTVVIAHRLSTIRDADRILVLDRGRVIANGPHEHILKTSDLYRRMWQRLIVGKSLDEPPTVDELAEAGELE
jgi:ATP-binding cassette subfamily B protein/subfamily B ATP-binding cassette protein MsbA